MLKKNHQTYKATCDNCGESIDIEEDAYNEALVALENELWVTEKDEDYNLKTFCCNNCRLDYFDSND